MLPSNTNRLVLDTGGDDIPAIQVGTLATAGLSAQEIKRLGSWLSGEEKIRARAFLHQEDSRDFTAAHALLRMELCAQFPDLPYPAPIEASSRGRKPRLTATSAACRGVDFNVTHTNGLVACVTARGSDVGIDAEALDRDIDLKLADICLSRQEQAWLTAQEHLSSQHTFLYLWTLKEAVIKAIGIGMATDLKAFTVLPFPPRIIDAGPDFGDLQRWALWQWCTQEGFVVAVAARR